VIQTAIIGGGPAGANCAFCLAQNGFNPIIFDHSHPREKPCGGLVTALAQKLFPFLKQTRIEHQKINKIHLISPSGNQTCIRLRNWILGFSRLKLDQYLVDRALDKGAELIKEKVVALKRKGNLWQLKTARHTYMTKNVIGADGINSLSRREIISPLTTKDKGFCLGYLVNELEDPDVKIKYSPYRKGFIWVIPRAQNTSIGISSTEISTLHGMKKELDMFIQQNYPNVKKATSWASLIPNAKDPRIFDTPLAGTNWTLIGDAAGHVDPISGEGILYALLDGELSAQAITENTPNKFDRMWREAYGINLFTAIKTRSWIYNKPVLELYCKSLKLLNTIQPTFVI
jgi:geranylgeranyl reductase family protein